MSITDRLAAAKEPIIKVDGLSMNFKVRGALFKALDEVSFSVNKGDFFGIIGESGSGKSTTGKCLIRLLTPSGGKMEVDGHLLSAPRMGKRTRRWLRSNIQMVFQDPMASLNPTKNIYQIISEPLSINHSARRDTLAYFNKVNAVSKYFRYGFITRESQLDYEFKKRYCESLAATLTKYARDYGEPIPAGSARFLREAAIAGLDELVTKVQALAEPIYEYLAQYKGLIKSDLEAYDKREFLPVDLALDKADIALRQARREYKYSRKGIDLLDKLKGLKAKLQADNIQFKETYRVKNRGYAKSWHATVKSKIKTLRQSEAYANNEVDGTYYTLQLLSARLERRIARRVKQQRRLEVGYAAAAEADAKANLQGIFGYLTEAYVKKAQAFPAAVGAAARLDIIDDVRCIKEIAKVYYRLLRSDEAWKSYDLFASKYTAALSLRSDERLFADLPAEKLFEDLNRYGNNLVAVMENGENGNETLRRRHNEEVLARKEEIIDARNAATDAIKAHADAVNVDPNLAFYAQNLRKAQDDFMQAKTVRDNEIARFLSSEWPGIQSRIAAQRLELRSMEGAQELALQLVARTIKAIQAEIAARAKAAGDGSPELTPKSLRAEFSVRLKSIDALRFEYRNAVKETRSYRRLYTWRPELTWLLYPHFITLKKRDAVYNALDSVGLKHEHAYRYPHEFSGGQRQRIVIARALITNPSVIIADEPISALDVSIQAQVINILKGLTDKKGITVLFIAHDLSMVNYVCNRVIIMHRGRILEQGDVKSIFSAPVHPYTKSLMLATPKLSRVHVDLSSFDDKFAYDAEWSLSNKPEFIPIEGVGDHLVYGTPEQVGKWVAETKSERGGASA